MIKIDDKRVIINSKEIGKINDYTTLKKMEYYKGKKIFAIKFTNDIKQNIKLLKEMKTRNEHTKFGGIDYNGYKLIGIVKNENEEIISCIRAIFMENRDEKYEFIYDTLCKQLDQKWIDENPCKFEDNICIFERQSKNPRENGCCYAFWYKNFGTQTYGVHQCEHLHPTEHCKNPNLTCKLFVCPYLKKYFNFRINTNELMLVELFFNRYQKILIRNNFFICKEEFLKKLKKDEHRIKPLLLYYVNRDFLVYKHTPLNKRKIVRRYEKIYRDTKGLRK